MYSVVYIFSHTVPGFSEECSNLSSPKNSAVHFSMLRDTRSHLETGIGRAWASPLGNVQKLTCSSRADSAPFICVFWSRSGVVLPRNDVAESLNASFPSASLSQPSSWIFHQKNACLWRASDQTAAGRQCAVRCTTVPYMEAREVKGHVHLHVRNVFLWMHGMTAPCIWFGNSGLFER